MNNQSTALLLRRTARWPPPEATTRDTDRWVSDSATELRTFQGHTGTVRAVSVTPDGRTAISGGHDPTVQVWNVEWGRPAAVLPGHSGPITSIAVAPNGRLAAEIAALSELTEDGVRARLFRVRVQLREWLGGRVQTPALRPACGELERSLMAPRAMSRSGPRALSLKCRGWGSNPHVP